MRYVSVPEIIEAAQAAIMAALAVVAIALSAVVVVGVVIGLCKVARAWWDEWRGGGADD